MEVPHKDVLISELERRLSEVDINLLIALDALLSHRNITYAGRRIGLSQPAMSRMLAKLRDFLGDDLLVRGSTGMRMTMRAEYLAQIVPLAMSQARGIIGTEGDQDGLRMAISVNLMPALLPHFAQSSNQGGQRLKISAYRHADDALNQLQSHVVDVILGSAVLSGEDVAYDIICREDFVTLTASELDNGTGLEMQAFLALSHINLTEEGEDIFPQVAEVLTANGLHRSDLTEISTVNSAAIMTSYGSYALTIPRSMAGWLMRTYPLHAFVPPVRIPDHEVTLSWLQSEDDKPLFAAEIMTVIRQALAEDRSRVRLDEGLIQERRGSNEAV